MKNLKLSLVLAFVLLPMSAFAAVPWTGNPGTATVDESVAGAYDQDNSSLDYSASGSTATIVARMNVTDTTATGYPSWTTMEIRAYDPSPNSEVRAKLIRVSSGGTVSTVATCATTDSAMVQTATCSIPQVDFNSGYIYAVSIELSRTTTAVAPFIYGVRIY